MKNLLVIASTIILSTFSSNVLAQERYINVGVDRTGKPVLLDTNSIQGNRFRLVHKFSDRYRVSEYQINCGNQLYLYNRYWEYNYSNNLIYISKPSDTSFYGIQRIKPETSIGRTAGLLCNSR